MKKKHKVFGILFLIKVIVILFFLLFFPSSSPAKEFPVLPEEVTNLGWIRADEQVKQNTCRVFRYYYGQTPEFWYDYFEAFCEHFSDRTIVPLGQIIEWALEYIGPPIYIEPEDNMYMDDRILQEKLRKGKRVI